MVPQGGAGRPAAPVRAARLALLDVNVNPDQSAGVKPARAVAAVAGVEVLTEVVGRSAAGELAALPAPGES